jgi:hypothetical protein
VNRRAENDGLHLVNAKQGRVFDPVAEAIGRQVAVAVDAGVVFPFKLIFLFQSFVG